MRRFLCKSGLFVFPFLLAYLTMAFYGTKQGGDLMRIGNLIDSTADYRNNFANALSEDVHYASFFSIGHNKKFDLLTIGDSFSQQKGYGYQNYLEKNGVDVLHFDRPVNAVQLLYDFLNADVLDTLSVKYVLLQSVERYFVQRISDFEKDKKFNIKKYHLDSAIVATPRYIPKFFSSSVIKFPLFNFLHLFDDNAFISDVYQVKTTEQLFSAGEKDLLFFAEDLECLDVNNKKENVELLNHELNVLSQELFSKGIKLIVLPSPDKYSVYYNYIEDEFKYARPLFFDHLSGLNKDYIFINSKQIIKELIGSQSDAYFYDDTHWSPHVSKLIAREIVDQICRLQENEQN